MRIDEALSDLRRLFLDSAPLIYHVEGHPLFLPKTKRIFEHIEANRLEAVTSSISLAECLVLPMRRQDDALVERFRERITRGKNTRYLGVDGVVEQAARLRASHGITLADAF